ncbi:MAG: exo-alpha-sialidase [Planctomycetes bacterium]|nr:exo-alpha-sialidase [Planctomycetota bacterium]
MAIEKIRIAHDPNLYHAWPDVTLTPSGKLVCIFSECTHHGDRSYTRFMLTESADRGRTWTPKRGLSEALRCDPKTGPFWNCARIVTLGDGRLCAIGDRVGGKGTGPDHSQMREQSNWLWFSADEGAAWEGPLATPVVGIVPDRLIELKSGPHAGRWLLAAHTTLPLDGQSVHHERVWLSDDRGANWTGPFTVAAQPGLKLCEGSIMELPGGDLVCFMRENSGDGQDAYKSVSRDGGRTWTGLVRFPLPGCHRPVAGMLQSGKILITYRFMQGGNGWLGAWTQNFFAALTDPESALATERKGARTRILPVDFDRSGKSDIGYSGWVQFPDGELFVVNYLVDDTAPQAHIRGYRLREEEFLLPQ